MLGHLVCSEETQKKILESDIFRIVESGGVTEIGALYKVSPSKFALIFESKTAKEKLQGTEIQCRFGNSEIKLSFRKRTEPLRNREEPIFVTINLPEYISDQPVRLAFSNFGEVVSVFKGRHKFNRKIRNSKRHVRVFPAGGDPAILPRKITFHDGILRDVLFAEKVVLCYRCKIRRMLDENCPVASPTPEGSDMPYTEQSETPRDNMTTEKPGPSVENQPSAESRQELSSIEERTDGENSSTDRTGVDSELGSTSESSDEDSSELGSSVPETPLKKPVTSAPQTNLAENRNSNDSTKSIQPSDTRTISQRPKLKSLRDFEISHLGRKLNSPGTIHKILWESNLRINQNTELAKKILMMTLDLLDNKTNADYLNLLNSHTVSLQTNYSIKYSRKKLDDFLYRIATRVSPHIMSEISVKTN